MGNGICEACPLDASLRAAEKLIRSANGHLSPSLALGGIALLRNSLEGVAENIDCTQHVRNPEGQLACPLADAANITRHHAYGRWMPEQFAVPLSSISTSTEQPSQPTPISTTGQYL